MEQLFEIKSRFGKFDYYRITKTGKVYSLISQSTRFGVNVLRNEPKELKQSKDTSGYLMVYLYNNEHKRKTIKVHTLIADTFISNPNNFKIINHINEIKTDNRVENLEWCTNKYNNIYNEKAIKIGLKLRDSNPRKKEVFKLDDSYNIIDTYKSVREAARSTGDARNDSNIHRAIKNNFKCCGYYWKFSDNLISRDNQQPS